MKLYSPLYNLLLAHDVGVRIKGSGDIRLGSFNWIRGRDLKVFIHRGGKITGGFPGSEYPCRGFQGIKYTSNSQTH